MARKAISKATRRKVYEKYGGHCAYCGKKIDYDEMQVDHLVPVCLVDSYNIHRNVDPAVVEDEENLMPACRRCNHYKRGNSLECFRGDIETIPRKLEMRNYIFKVAVDYGFFDPERRKVEFYFERFGKDVESNGQNDAQG